MKEETKASSERSSKFEDIFGKETVHGQEHDMEELNAKATDIETFHETKATSESESSSKFEDIFGMETGHGKEHDMEEFNAKATDIETSHESDELVAFAKETTDVEKVAEAPKEVVVKKEETHADVVEKVFEITDVEKAQKVMADVATFEKKKSTLLAKNVEKDSESLDEASEDVEDQNKIDPNEK